MTDAERPLTPKGPEAAPTTEHSVRLNGMREEVAIFHVDGVGKLLAVLPTIPEDARWQR